MLNAVCEKPKILSVRKTVRSMLQALPLFFHPYNDDWTYARLMDLFNFSYISETRSFSATCATDDGKP